MNFLDFSDRSRQILVRVFLLFFALAAVIGWRFSTPGYWGAFLAGISANALALAFGLWAVDRYAEARKRADWERVRGFVVAEIRLSLSDVAASAEFFRLDLANYRELLTINPGEPDKTAEALEVASRELKTYVDTLDGGTLPEEFWKGLENSLHRFLKATSLRCDQVQGTLLPLVIAAGGDTELVEGLVGFGFHFRKLGAGLEVKGAFEASRQAWLPFTLQDVIRLLAFSSKLYRTLERKEFNAPRSVSVDKQSDRHVKGPPRGLIS